MAKDREAIAKEMAIANGYEWEGVEKAVRDAWLEKADAVIATSPEPLEEALPDVCSKCGGRGFNELEHGLNRVFCDCEKGKELRVEITGEGDDNPKYLIIPEALPNKTIDETIDVAREIIKASKVEIDGDKRNSGTKQDDSSAGSADTRQPKQPRKRKKKKKAGKRTSKLLPVT